ncbi:MAG: cysteine desulfurase family protein [Bdellovibrionia bacterium]
MSPRFATYLDANAGAPLGPEVREALLRALSSELLPNPSSIHAFGREAKKLLNDARENVARSFGVSSSSDQITFTSSGTEASQLAIRSVLEPAFHRGEKPHWITTPVEHDATLRMIDWTKERGGSVSFLPIDSNGAPDAQALSELVTPATRLVSAIWVNNETGVISNVEKLSEKAAQAKIPLHLDGAQAWGKLELDLPKLGAAFVSFSGHKIGALSGTGVLWKAKAPLHFDGALSPVILGTQESLRRGGTENLAGIISLGEASMRLKPAPWDSRVRPVRERLEKEILGRISEVKVNGAGAPRVANTLSLSFEGINRSGLVPALDLAGFAVSSGSACSSGVDEPSHVLMAMGHSKGSASASIRVSLCDEISEETQNRFIEALSASVQRLRKSN